MKTLSRPLAALTLLAGLSAPAAAIWPFSDPAPAGPLGAVLAEAQGAVFVQKAGQATPTSAAAQTALDAGDLVKTGVGGRAVVAFLDGSKMQLKENASFSVAGHSAKKVSVKIDLGTVQYWIAKQAKRRRYELRTPTAVASVRGTSGEVEVALNGESFFAQWTGSTDVTDSRGNNVRLEANQQVTSDDQKGLEGAKVEPLATDKQAEPEPTIVIQGDAPKEEVVEQDDSITTDSNIKPIGEDTAKELSSPVSTSNP